MDVMAGANGRANVRADLMMTLSRAARTSSGSWDMNPSSVVAGALPVVFGALPAVVAVLLAVGGMLAFGGGI